MLKQAKHLKCIVLMTIGQRISAVVRVQLVIGNGDARQAGAALRVEPFAAALDVAVRAQQFFNIMTAVELINHRGSVAGRLHRCPGRLGFGLFSLWYPRAS